jgi:hypothetical protein|tara:strand:+ start:404 stop:520 length:117 start_codon:yes stop_codon:yes gene_type:complete
VNTTKYDASKVKAEFKDFTFEAKNSFGASAGQGGDSYG